MTVYVSSTQSVTLSAYNDNVTHTRPHMTNSCLRRQEQAWHMYVMMMIQYNIRLLNITDRTQLVEKNQVRLTKYNSQIRQKRESTKTRPGANTATSSFIIKVVIRNFNIYSLAYIHYNHNNSWKQTVRKCPEDIVLHVDRHLYTISPQCNHGY